MLSIDNIMVEHFFWWVAGKKKTADTYLYVRVCVSQWRIQGGLWWSWPPFLPNRQSDTPTGAQYRV